MIKTTKIKNQKPVEIDAYIKYICPNNVCCIVHWLSLKQTQVNNFKVVCDCGTVFSPKVIKRLKPIFRKLKSEPILKKHKETILEPPKDLLDSCSQLLIDYGFTVDETVTLLNKAIEKNPSVTSGALLVKYILEHIGELK